MCISKDLKLLPNIIHINQNDHVSNSKSAVDWFPKKKEKKITDYETSQIICRKNFQKFIRTPNMKKHTEGNIDILKNEIYCARFTHGKI